MYNLSHDGCVIYDQSLALLEKDNVIERLKNQDGSLWPGYLKSRLGWLESPENILHEEYDTTDWRQYRYVVVIGMGGSVTGTKVIFNMIERAGAIKSIILDTTIPQNIDITRHSIDCKQTLFIICSKSGKTIETNTLYRYFRNILNNIVGEDNAGQHFVAITDLNSDLHELAYRENFKKVFINDSSIGGRYSVLSRFGMVPAQAIGVDTYVLLQKAAIMADYCNHETVKYNPGALLGTFLGTMIKMGRDKCVIICDQKTHMFAKWLEQLLSESTGKNGTGIIPVILDKYDYIHSCDTFHYDFVNSNDRFYVVLADNENIVWNMGKGDIPFANLLIDDVYDIGAEFFRWQYATAIAGYFMQINPFDEPNVQSAKDQTVKILDEYKKTNVMPIVENNLYDLKYSLINKKSTDYLAINAYLHETYEINHELERLKYCIERYYNILVNIEFGPRYLHSTGQLQKGGKNNVIILNLTQNYTRLDQFDILAKSQFVGDALALDELDRCVINFDLGSDVLGGLENIRRTLISFME